MKNATAPVSTLTQQEKLELLLYTCNLLNVPTSGRKVKAVRYALNTLYISLLQGAARPYNGATEDIVYLYEELGWELPQLPKTKAPVVTAPAIAAAAAQVAKAQAAPATPPRMTYRELQAACKAAGLKANGNYATLERRLSGAGTVTVTATVVPADDTLSIAKAAQAKATKPAPDAPKAAKARKPKAAPRTHHGLSYRETQSVVKFLKGFAFDTSKLVRNTGWDNVAANLDALMSQPAWGRKFGKAYLAECPALAKLLAAVA